MANRTWFHLRIALVLSVLLIGVSACVSKGAYEQLQEQQGQTQEQLSAQQAEVTRLRAALSQEQTRSTDLSAQVAGLQSELSQAQGTAAGLEQQVSELQAQLTAAQGQVAGLEQQVLELQAQLTAAQGQVADLEGQIADLKIQLSAAQSQVASLEAEVSRLGAELEAEEGETSRLASELSQATSTNESLTQQIDSLKTNLSGAQSLNSSLTQQIEDLRSQVTFLQSIIAARTAQTQSLAQVISLARPAIVRIQTPSGEGSGFFFDKEGRILTNAHVVGNVSSVTVVVDDSRSLAGQVVGRHEVMDVAVVKVALGRNATFLALGDSDQAEVGEEVLAMGYPLGSTLGGQATVTKGVLSARRQDGNTQYLQIDASLNPGNSGGPLINSKGEAIGINRWVVRQVGGTTIEGIGFAIAINPVKDILASLMAGGVATAPTTGWSTYDNAAWGYSIQVAPGWTVDDTEKDDIVIWSSSRAALVQVFGQVVTGYTLESWTAKGINFYRARATSFTEVSRSRVLLPGGVPAYSILFTFTLPGDSTLWKVTTVLAVAGNRAFEVWAITSESSWDRYGSALEQMALSFAPRP